MYIAWIDLFIFCWKCLVYVHEKYPYFHFLVLCLALTSKLASEGENSQFFYRFIFCWDVVDLVCVNFCCTAKVTSLYMFIYVPSCSYSLLSWFITGFWIWLKSLLMHAGDCPWRVKSWELLGVMQSLRHVPKLPVPPPWRVYYP